MNKLECLGILKGSNCPHYDGEPDRPPAYQRLIANKTMLPGIACEDSVALHFINEALVDIVSSVEGKVAYRYELEDQLQETLLKPTYLGKE